MLHFQYLSFMYVHSILYSSTVSYILYGRKMRSVQPSIILCASLLLLLLLLQLLIVIYACDGMYNETIIMDCMSTYMLNLLSCPCPSVPHKDNYYTIIPSIYVQLGDAVDCFISLYEGVMLVQITWYT